jgi:anti-anti-sigma regulatory factor
MASVTKVRVEAGWSGSALVIKPLGPCTVAICGDVLNYLKRLSAAEVTDIYFDLSEAGAIDSTFAGFLVALATSGTDAPVPAAHLLAPSEPVVQALERMYVLGLFDVCPAMPQPPTEWQELPAEPLSSEKLTDLVIEAHQELINADRRNAPAFRTLVATLQASKKRKPADGASGPQP